MHKKTELKQKIEELVNAYQENAKAQSGEIANTINGIKPTMKHYKDEGLIEILHNQIDPIVAGWKSIDKMYNQKFLEIVEEGENIFKSITQAKEIPDHAMKMNNALQMINMMNPDTDEKMFMILKEFVEANDFDSLKIFKEIIGQNTELENAVGECTCEKTFGSYNQHETMVNLFADLREIGSTLFLHERHVEIPIVTVGMESFGVPVDGYSESVDEQNAILCGGQTDSMVNSLVERSVA